MRGPASQWKGVESIGQVISYTTINGHQTSHVRCYISSFDPKVNEFAVSVRGHWAIESMHWILDVVFREDSSRLRSSAVAEDFSLLRKLITSLLNRDTREERHHLRNRHYISISKPLRLSRERNALASSSPMISRFAGSQFNSRPNRIAMFAK